MKIILIAPPAAGKGTQATKLSKKYGIVHISTGDLLRSSNDESLKEELKKGDFVSDEIVYNLLVNRLKKDDCCNGYILDGFPRNLKQAYMYEKLENDKVIVIILDLNKEISYKRMVGRETCLNCGEVYNYLFDDSKPKVSGICDNCGSKLYRRDDDNAETFEKRYKIYETDTKPLIKFYEDKGIAYHVDSSIDALYTFKQIEDIIGGIYDKY